MREKSVERSKKQRQQTKRKQNRYIKQNGMAQNRMKRERESEVIWFISHSFVSEFRCFTWPSFYVFLPFILIFPSRFLSLPHSEFSSYGFIYFFIIIIFFLLCGFQFSGGSVLVAICSRTYVRRAIFFSSFFQFAHDDSCDIFLRFPFIFSVYFKQSAI